MNSATVIRWGSRTRRSHAAAAARARAAPPPSVCPGPPPCTAAADPPGHARGPRRRGSDPRPASGGPSADRLSAGTRVPGIGHDPLLQRPARDAHQAANAEHWQFPSVDQLVDLPPARAKNPPSLLDLEQHLLFHVCLTSLTASSA